MAMASPGKGPATTQGLKGTTSEHGGGCSTGAREDKRLIQASRPEPQTLTNACTHTKEGFSH